jgi:hypothetical protein
MHRRGAHKSNLIFILNIFQIVETETLQPIYMGYQVSGDNTLAVGSINIFTLDTRNYPANGRLPQIIFANNAI